MSESNANETNEQNGHEFATQWRTRCLEPLMRSVNWFIEHLEHLKEKGIARETEEEIFYQGHLACYGLRKIPLLEKMNNPLSCYRGLPRVRIYPLNGSKLSAVYDNPPDFCIHGVINSTHLPAGDILQSLQLLLIDDRAAFHLIDTLQDALVQLYGLGPSPITPALIKWWGDMGATYDPEMRTVEFAGTHGFRFQVKQTWPGEYVCAFKQRGRNWRTFPVEAFDYAYGTEMGSQDNWDVMNNIHRLSRIPGDWMSKADPTMAEFYREYIPLVGLIAARFAPLRRALAEVLADRTEEE